MKSEMLILGAEKISGAAICNLGGEFKTIYKKRCLLSLHIRDACLLKYTIFLNLVTGYSSETQDIFFAEVLSVFPLQTIAVQRRSNKECKCT